MDNPAAQHCIDVGGRVEVVETGAGQASVCVLPDGTRCDAWALYRGQCGPQRSAVRWLWVGLAVSTVIGMGMLLRKGR